jgi:oxygen-independent coproporphyrinogen III oxidase
MDAFIEALLHEIDLYAQDPPFGGFSVSTIYFGGGTPSLLSPKQVEKILKNLNFFVTPGAEITLEANPGATERASLVEYRRLGVNRLSLGIQSFHDQELQLLSRIHTADEAEQSIEQGRQAGFDNISLDFIYAIPGQDRNSWNETLKRAVEFHPEHISAYSLTIEAGTPLSRLVDIGRVQPCEEELERELFLLTQETLEKSGYEQYEISNYSLPGFRSRHNQKYWAGTPYLGLGPSSHSFDGRRRWWNLRDVDKYISTLRDNVLPKEGMEELSVEQQLTESILLGLRRKEGLEIADLWSSLQPAIEAMGGIDKEVSAFQASPTGKLFARVKSHLVLTQEGLLLYNYVCEKLCSQII